MDLYISIEWRPEAPPEAKIPQPNLIVSILTPALLPFTIVHVWDATKVVIIARSKPRSATVVNIFICRVEQEESTREEKEEKKKQKRAQKRKSVESKRDE